MQECQSWNKEVISLKIGAVVFISDDNVAPLQWPLGRIARVDIGPDIFLRTLQVRNNLESTTELYLNLKNCNYRLTEKFF